MSCVSLFILLYSRMNYYKTNDAQSCLTTYGTSDAFQVTNPPRLTNDGDTTAIASPNSLPHLYTTIENLTRGKPFFNDSVCEEQSKQGSRVQ